MILKMPPLGMGARGLLEYMAEGAGHARPDFTNMAGATPRQLAREVAALRRLRPNLNKAVAHLVLSHDPKDRPLTREEWQKALDTALAAHGAQGAVHAAYLHEETEHTHLHVFFYASRQTARSSATPTHTGKTRPPRARSSGSWVFTPPRPGHQNSGLAIPEPLKS